MKRKANNDQAVDKYIGSKIREARVAKGMSMIQLAAQIGDITHQQLYKYEEGANRTPNTRLLKIAKITERGMLFFFPEGFEDTAQDTENNRLTIEIVRNVQRIPNYKVKKAINVIINAIAESINNCNKT